MLSFKNDPQRIIYWKCDKCDDGDFARQTWSGWEGMLILADEHQKENPHHHTLVCLETDR